MSDEDDATPSVPVRRSWKRCRLYLWSILLSLSFWLYGGAYVLRHAPQRFVDQALAQLPYPSSVAEVKWTTPETLELDDIKIGAFFYADSIVASASPRDLLHHRIRSLTIVGPQLFMAALNKAMSGPASAGGTSGLDWTIDKLTLQRGTLLVDAGPQMPSIPIRIGAVRPVIINNLRLSRPDASPAMNDEHIVELENIHLSSPFDPLAPVLSLPLTRVRFTYTEIWKHHIREVDLIRPNLFLGQDLFWFTDMMKKERASSPAAGPGSPWQVGHFEVQYGQLSVNAFGQPRVQFPFFYDTKVDDIQLDQLEKISAKSVIAIRHFSRDYPDYKIKIVNLEGKLEFSLPPADSQANNVVPTVSIDELSWNGIAATKVWSSATFDPTGIYVRLGGNCEKGLMAGDLQVYYTQGFAWNANFFANKIDCRPVAEKLAGKYMKLSGTLDGKISVQGRATDILKCDGALTLAHPGLLEIQSMNDLLRKLPVKTPPLKRDALKLLLNAFSYYPYETGMLKIDYRPGEGEGTLHLDGPRGKRDFEIYWHPFESSKIAKEEDSH